MSYLPSAMNMNSERSIRVRLRDLSPNRRLFSVFHRHREALLLPHSALPATYNYHFPSDFGAQLGAPHAREVLDCVWLVDVYILSIQYPPRTVDL